MGEQRLSGQSGRKHGCGGGEKEHAPGPIRQKDQEPEGDEDSKKSHGSDLLQ
jgi:hypothetical protein